MKGEYIVNALYKAMSENPDKKILELFDIARKFPAPCFSVTFNNARRLVSMLDRGLELPIVNENKKAMYKELHRRLNKARGDKEKCYQLLNDIIESLNIYDNIVDCIEWLIKEDYFNKEYLKQ